MSVVLLFASWSFSHAADDRTAAAEESFALRVWPLVETRCLPCHGEGKELAGGLDLRSEAAALKGGDSGTPSLVPRDSRASALVRAATRIDEEFSAMPPKENDRLSAEEIALLAAWIDAGAPWPDAERRAMLQSRAAPDADRIEVATSGGLSPQWTSRKYVAADLWAYRPLDESPLPSNAAGHPIDRWIQRTLDGLKLVAAPRADRKTLIRRATFDLLGLPPTLDEVVEFERDSNDDPTAFAKVIDRLLASPHYGEHWGRHWLDVTRYADSSGFANDYERGNAWRYRDYVVRAFNADKPFDDFAREQIAGDEIDETNPELLVATGFLRMGPWELTGMEVAKVARQRFLDDVTDVVGQAFLAHPLQCARCHDHKFDPIPTRDYYGVQAVFATTQLAERPAPFLPDENISGFEERQFLEQRRERFQSILADLEKKETVAAQKWCEERGFEYVPRQQGLKRGIPDERLPPKHVGFEPADYGMERIARKGLERLRWEMERYEPFALSVYSGRTPPLKSVSAPLRVPEKRSESGELEATSILAGGDPFSPTLPVKPGAISALESLAGSSAPHYPEVGANVAGRRLALANWIADSQNPLTARVLANRLWQWHFGRGLVATSNNFGTTGKKPTHPELLDALARAVVERGWSLKAMHRLIMTSEAYQRATEHPNREELTRLDPSGTSYAVFAPRRLTAEELRDSILNASGDLNRAIGGIPSRPEIHVEVALQPRQVMGTFASAWQPSPSPEQRHRRSLYSLRIRGLRDPFAEVFNEPSMDLSCEVREVSTVSPQVFGLFNSRQTYDRALAFAVRVQEEATDSSAAIRAVYARALGRLPSQNELQACLTHWETMTDRHRDMRLEDRPRPKEIVRTAVEENTGERFEFIEVLEAAPAFTPDVRVSELSAETRGLAELCLVLFNTNEFIYVY